MHFTFGMWLGVGIPYLLLALLYLCHLPANSSLFAKIIIDPICVSKYPYSCGALELIVVNAKCCLGQSPAYSSRMQQRQTLTAGGVVHVKYSSPNGERLRDKSPIQIKCILWMLLLRLLSVMCFLMYNTMQRRLIRLKVTYLGGFCYMCIVSDTKGRG